MRRYVLWTAAGWALVAAMSHCNARVVNAVDLVGAGDGAVGDAAVGVEASSAAEASAPNDGGGGGLPWPNATSSKNSDPWLVAHHDQITELDPRIMVLDFYTHFDLQQAEQQVLGRFDALAEASRYHGYADPSAPRFLNYTLVGLIDLTASPPNWQFEASNQLPLTSSGTFDPNALFSTSFAKNYGITDPSNPAQYLTLCQLFEQGIINELWLMTGDEQTSPLRRPPLMIESKQMYDAHNTPIPGMFSTSTGDEPFPAANCNVTARVAYISPTRGMDCDLTPRSIDIENMHFAIPYLGTNGSAFFNSDFSTRFATPFNSWADFVSKGWCTSSTCISYPSQTVAQVTIPDGGLWTIDPYRQGCGTAHFPPNARSEWDYANSEPVQSRCEHYDMLDGPGGVDQPDVYTADKMAVASYTSLYGTDHCGGGWQIYYRQNMPGYHNHATAADGTPMKNWWPFLFY